MQAPDSVAATGDARLLGALAQAAFIVDPERRIVLANEAAAELLGVAEGDLPGTRLLPRLFAEPEQGAADEVLTRVFGGEPWQGELLVLHRDGAPRAASISVGPLPDVGGTAGALLVVEDAGSSRRRAHRLTDRLTRLARVTAELLRADDVTTVTTIVTRHMADAAGATVASLSVLVTEDRLRLLGIHGGRAGVAARWETFDVAGTPAGDCITARRPLILIGRDAIRSRYPHLESAADGERSVVCLPVAGRRAGDRCGHDVLPRASRVRHRRARLLQRHGGHLRAGPRPGAGPRRRGRPVRKARVPGRRHRGAREQPRLRVDPHQRGAPRRTPDRGLVRDRARHRRRAPHPRGRPHRPGEGGAGAGVPGSLPARPGGAARVVPGVPDGPERAHPGDHRRDARGRRPRSRAGGHGPRS